MTKAPHALIVLALCLFALGVSVAPALAASETFAGPEPGSGAGQVNDPVGVAVDQTSGVVYVGDNNDRRIDEFDSTGHFLLAFGIGVATGAPELQTCTTVCIQGVEDSSAEELPGAIRSGSVAVNQVTHDVYVADIHNKRVEEFTPSGELVLMFGKGIDKGGGIPSHPGDICTAEYISDGDQCTVGTAGTGEGQFEGGSQYEGEDQIAIDASGNVWVGDAHRLEEFSAQGAFLSQIKLPAGLPVQGLAIDTDATSPSFGDFYVNTASIDESQSIEPPTSGTYTLTFEGQTTAPLKFDASVREVEQALASLSTVGSPNINVTAVIEVVNDKDIAHPPFTVEFRQSFAGINVPQIVASAGSIETRQDGVPGKVEKFSPTGALLQTLESSGNPIPTALTVDPATGDLFVSNQPVEGADNPVSGRAALLEFDASGAELEAFGTGEVLGRPIGNAFAFGDSAKRLFVVGGNAFQGLSLPLPGPLVEAHTAEATEVHKTGATLGASIRPEGAETTYHFQYISEAQFLQDGEAFGAGAVTTPESGSIGESFEDQAASFAIAPGDLRPGTSYRFRVVATNAKGTNTGETASFETLPVAGIDSTSVAEVTATSATLQAQVNPLGDATSYRFEYLTEAQYEANGESFSGPAVPSLVPSSDLAIGAGSEDVSVSQHLQGLSPSIVYRYRVFAHNHCNPAQPAEECTVSGPALSFTTQSSGVFTLPDGREWEMVSPPNKHGANLLSLGESGLAQASAAGDAMTFLASAPTEAEPQGYASEVQVLSTRGGTEGSSWSSQDIATPNDQAPGLNIGEGQEYRFFSNDLSLGLMQPRGVFVPQLSSEASEQTPYLRSDFPAGDVGSPCVTSCFRPLVSGAPGAANVPEGVAFGEEGKCPPALECGPIFVGATSDLSHVVFKSLAALTSTQVKNGLYEWSAGELALVSILPTNGKGEQTPVGDAQLGRNSTIAKNAISSNGSHVVWSEVSSGHLYLRDTAKGETLQLDAVQGGPGAAQAPSAQFKAASVDGSRVFFTDSQQLTSNSGNSPKGPDLYECEIAEVAGKLHCALSDLTPAGAGVQGVVGASEDGSWVYFVADGVLGDGAQRGAPVGGCEINAIAGTCNLYAWHEGVTRLAAVLSANDSNDWRNDSLADLTGRVSPDGHWLTFMSLRSLTGYDNRDASSGSPDEEVYLYSGETDKLACASCNPSGARPRGVEYNKLNDGLVGGDRVWNESTWIAANVPGWTAYRLTFALYQPRYLSDSGRLFFNSSDALVPQDTNGAEDVYEYEPSGVGDCAVSSATFSAHSNGCVGLISSGTSFEESAFLDASESGDDVFFLSSAKLAPQDIDTALDVYDAHVCGSSVACPAPPPAPAPACEGDACQSQALAPEDPTPGSLTFSGPGNPPAAAVAPVKSKPKTAVAVRAEKLTKALKACRKKQKRKRLVCERQARRTYGAASKAKRSNRRGK